MTDVVRPHPEPDGETLPFWEALAEGRLCIQRCGECHEYVFYPRSVCPHCMSAQLAWVLVSGRGTVYSYTVVHRAPPGFEADVPYVVALIELDEGPRLMTRLEADEVRIGMAVELAAAGNPPLPYFKRRTT